MGGLACRAMWERKTSYNMERREEKKKKKKKKKNTNGVIGWFKYL